MPTVRQQPAALVLVALTLLVACSEDASVSQPPFSWGHYGSDPGSSKYAPLGQIDAENFATLEIAWSWTSADIPLLAELKRQRKAGKDLGFVLPKRFPLRGFQGTPIQVGTVLYGVTSIGQVYALDAISGRQLWVHDPESYRNFPRHFFPRHRGASYWRQGDDERIFLPTIDAYLIALDARTGQPIPSFGRDGRVDLLEGLRHDPGTRVRDYSQTSPAAIAGDTVVVGSSIFDQPTSMTHVPGDVRGYDARTGSLRWSFHTVPSEGEVGTETWQEESWRYSGAANAWGLMSVDEERGLVYVPTSTPTNDYYGGHRPGDNLFAETLLCLDAMTGERRWHQQIVRHGLWDYDLSAAPNLLTLHKDGREIDAVAQVTKHGFTFVFDRVTGEPVWPIEDRPVPASQVPGERTAATQRFPLRPPPFERQGLTEDDLLDLTPELHAAALEAFRRYESGPLFTPPSIRGTFSVPGPGGGASWYGAGVDPETATLFVASRPLATSLQVRPPTEKRGSEMKYEITIALPVFVPEDGRRRTQTLPMMKPPFSQLSAIDLNRGELLWQVPLGETMPGHPLLEGLDLPPVGAGALSCVLVTKTLVIAADGSDVFHPQFGAPILRAYDKATGRVVASIDLPTHAVGCPMSYELEGRQYIVFGAAALGRKPRLIALALPDPERRRAPR